MKTKSNEMSSPDHYVDNSWIPGQTDQSLYHFIISSGPARGLGPGGAAATLGVEGAEAGVAAGPGVEVEAGAEAVVEDEDFPPRALLLPPRLVLEAPPRPPRPSCVAGAVVPLRSVGCFSPSVFLLPRERRDVPPREPGPRNGSPVSCEIGTAAAIGTCGCEAKARPRPVPRPRPRPRLIVPSAL